MCHPKPSTTPSTSQGHEEPAREDEDARGRSSSRGPQSRHRKNRSSTRGSRKCRRGILSDDPMDEMSNYVASGWKQDLTHIIGCCWEAQVGPLDSEEWEVAICKFLAVMRNRKAVEWTDIKELTPLQFMPYVADLFREVMGKYLQGLSRFTDWIRLGGYYHWKVAQLGLLHACPCLQGQPVPREPMAHPSGRPHPPRLTQTETLAAGASGRHQDGAQPTPDRGGRSSTSGQGGKSSTSSQGGKSSASSQGGKTSTPRQSSKLASTGRGEKPTTSGGPVDLPPEREGAGNGAWANWYQRTLRGAEGGTSEPQGTPYPIGMAQGRREAIGQIYNCVDGKDPLQCNIASEALQAYYSGVDPQTLKTWACQILCMISEYHMACVTRGSLVTSPILPGEIEDWLPPLTDYTPPEDRSGVNDIRVRDHQARTLRMAVWLHRLHMALSEEPAASGSLVRTQHSLRCLLAYFLGPITAWSLQFEDVIDQVLRENQRHNEKKHTDATSSLQKCRNRQTKLRTEFDAVLQAMEVITNAPSSREMEHRLNTLQTSLSTVERSITKFENIIEDCRMLEEEVCHVEEDEACLEEEICQEEGEITDIEMAEEEERGDPEPSGPCGEADTEDPPPLASTVEAVSPEEDALLMQPAPQPKDPVAGSHSPRSETGRVSGEMAELCLTSPSQPGHEEDEIQP